MMSSDDDGDNKDLKCGAPECNHQRFKSQQEREEHSGIKYLMCIL